jgi:hypothetical protein
VADQIGFQLTSTGPLTVPPYRVPLKLSEVIPVAVTIASACNSSKRNGKPSGTFQS